MKTNSNSRTAALTLMAAVIALILVSWPTTGRSQSSSRRDRERFRRDYPGGQDATRSGSTRPDASGRPGASKSEPGRRETVGQPGPKSPTRDSASKTDAARSGASQQTGRITGPADPNAAPRPVERRSSRRAVKDEQWAKYEIILDRNMFSRQRIPVRRGDDTPPPPPIMPNPESYFLLKGVAQENNQFIAFVEDKKTGVVLRLRQGDHVARGEIKSLTLDSLEYQLQDKTTTVTMGYDLEGRHGAVTAEDLANFTPAAMTAAPAASGQPAGQPAAPSANEAEILKRLMENRKQQLGQ